MTASLSAIAEVPAAPSRASLWWGCMLMVRSPRPGGRSHATCFLTLGAALCRARPPPGTWSAHHTEDPASSVRRTRGPQPCSYPVEMRRPDASDLMLVAGAAAGSGVLVVLNSE